MEKELVHGDIAKIGDYDVSFEGGKLVAKIEIGAVDLAIAGIQQLKILIPGHIDDLILDSAIAAIQALK